MCHVIICLFKCIVRYFKIMSMVFTHFISIFIKSNRYHSTGNNNNDTNNNDNINDNDNDNNDDNSNNDLGKMKFR